jgi:hypothetical protein
MLPRAYEMPVIKIQNNLKMHKKNENVFTIKYKHYYIK